MGIPIHLARYRGRGCVILMRCGGQGPAGKTRRRLSDYRRRIRRQDNGFDDETEGRLSGLKYFRPCCESHAPLDLIILMLGTNDLKERFGVNVRTIAYGFRRYRDVVNTLPESAGKPAVLLVSPVRINPAYKNHLLFHDMFGEYAAERSEMFAAAYQEAAGENGWFFLDAALFGRASEEDGIHMDISSHQRLGCVLSEEVRKILE